MTTHLLLIGIAIALHHGCVFNQHFYLYSEFDAGGYVVAVFIGLLIGIHQDFSPAQVVDYLLPAVKRAFRYFGKTLFGADKFNLRRSGNLC